MAPWLWFWAPQIHFPWSGAVQQQIDPSLGWFFGAIAPDAGNGRVEKKAFEVASYGKQLGLITDLLIDQAEQKPPRSADAKDALVRLKKIRSDINDLKARDAEAFAHEIESRLDVLRRTNAPAFAALSARLRPRLV